MQAGMADGSAQTEHGTGGTSVARRWARFFWVTPLLVLLIGASGCSTACQNQKTERRFDFNRDAFAYQNGLVWEYGYDAQGKWRSHKRVPSPDYSQHCFVVARSARQFFQNARFEPTQPPADEQTYRRLIRAVESKDPKTTVCDSERVVIPGYPGLRAFSAAHERILKEECGGAWQSYVQRGNWRMIFPFSRHQQAQVAEQLLRELEQGRPPVIHLVRFPQLTINHAVLVFDAQENGAHVDFTIYDPNDSSKPGRLTFDRRQNTFFLPANNYFPGGKVNAYEIYRSWDY